MMKFVLIIGIVTWYLMILTNAENIVKRHDQTRPDVENNDANNKKSLEPKLSAVQMVAGGERRFSNKYYHYAIFRNEENWVFSPLSIYMVLAMAAYGAELETKSKLFEILEISENESDYVKEGFKNLLADLANYHNYYLRVENKFFLYDSNYGPARKYSHIMTSFFQKTDNYLPRGVIKYPPGRFQDNWNLLKTYSAPYKNVIASTDFDFNSTVILDSSLYFKAEWKTQFSTKVTHVNSFMDTGEYPVDIMIMYIYGKFRHGTLTDIDADFIQLPLKGDCSLFIIRSNRPNEVIMPTFLIDISKLNLDDLCDKGVEKNVHLYLPRFTIETSSSIKSNIKNMGLRRLNEFGHSAILDVHEFGIGPVGENNTEKSTSIPEDTPDFITFRVTDPFLAIVATTGQVRVNLLMAHYMGPNDAPRH